MAETVVMREFLVALGFRVDEKSLKNFTNTVDDATKKIGVLVGAVGAAALTIGAGVAAFASNLEGLYFQSQRTKATVVSLKALQVAGQDLGATAQETSASLEGMTRFMRDNPGGEGVIQNLGVQTRDANGQLRDTVDIMADVGKSWSAMPWYQAKPLATMLGIDDNTLAAIRSGDFIKYLDAARSRLKNSGFDAAAKESHRLMDSLRDLMQTFDGLAARIEERVLQRAIPALQQFAEWVDKNAGRIADNVSDAVDKLMPLATSLAQGFGWLLDKLVILDSKTDGWSTKLLGLLAVMRLIGATSIVTGVLSLAAAFFRLATGIGAAGAAGSTAAAAGGGLGLISKLGLAGILSYGAIKVGEKTGLTPETDVAKGKEALKRGDWMEASRLLPAMDFLGAVYDKAIGMDPVDGIGKKERPNVPPMQGVGQKQFDAMAFFQSAGWSKDQAAGIVANLHAESGLNANAVGDHGDAYGVAQWHPDRQKNFEKWAGKPIRDASLQEQFEFVNYELTAGAERKAGAMLAAAQNASQAANIVSRYYERPAAGRAEAANRAAAALTISQDVQINVNGAGNPEAVGRSVANEQNRLGQDLARNLQGAGG